MYLFYIESDIQSLFRNGRQDISLPGEEAAHLKVLRLRPGEKIVLTDGLGNFGIGEVIDNSQKSNLISLKEVRTVNHPSWHVHIAVAPTKNIARFEWFLEKATEIGIDEITPFYSEHSERVNLRTDRLNKVIISAMKQSIKAYMPKLNDPLPLNKFLDNASAHPGNCFLAWLDRQNTLPHLKSVCNISEPATVLIGPEGDFSPAEVILAKQRGFIPVSLGSARLRTETAALSACFIVNLLNEPNQIGYSEIV